MTEPDDLSDLLRQFGDFVPTDCATAGKSSTRGDVLPDLDAAFAALSLSDGAVLSFHHHLRNGDQVMVAALDAAARAGLRDLHIAPSSIFPTHAPLIAHMQSGVIARISTSFMSGPVAEAVSRGVLKHPVILSTHGGRARAIRMGELVIDAAFIAAPAADRAGNISGTTGPSACGVLGYPQCDALHARQVVAVTDTLVPYPVPDIQIAQDLVHHVALMPSLGDVSGIASGTTRVATSAKDLGIARRTAQVIEASGLLKQGFSLQNGAGGISLATAAEVGQIMGARGVRGGFASGGITGQHVDMLEAGLFDALLNVQCFDLRAVQSFANDRRHQGMSASVYANPMHPGPVVDHLDAMVLGAAEIDLEFNVNVSTRADGVIIGGSGGHADAAAGARLSIVTTKLTAAGYPKIVERVGTLTTPGASIDVLVTEAGIAINPRRPELCDRLQRAGLPVAKITDLYRLASSEAEREPLRATSGMIVGLSQYRDGTISDVIRGI